MYFYGRPSWTGSFEKAVPWHSNSVPIFAKPATVAYLLLLSAKLSRSRTTRSSANGIANSPVVLYWNAPDGVVTNHPVIFLETGISWRSIPASSCCIENNRDNAITSILQLLYLIPRKTRSSTKGIVVEHYTEHQLLVTEFSSFAQTREPANETSFLWDETLIVSVHYNPAENCDIQINRHETIKSE